MSFLDSRISIDNLGLYDSFTTLRWKERGDTMTRESFLKSLSPLTRPPHTFSLLMISPVTLPRHSRESDSLSLPVVSPSPLSLVTRVTSYSRRGRGLSSHSRTEREWRERKWLTFWPRHSLSLLVTFSPRCLSIHALPSLFPLTLPPHSLSLLSLLIVSLAILSLLSLPSLFLVTHSLSSFSLLTIEVGNRD